MTITPGITPGTATSRRFRKDAIRVGSYDVPGLGPVSQQRLGLWADMFGLMRERGVSVPLTVDHLPASKAEAKRGSIVGMLVEGDRLMFDTEVPDEECETLLGRCPEVSVEITPNFRDGKGNLYPEAITAISLTPVPIVPGQEPFQRIAASRTAANGAGSGTAESLVYRLSVHSPAASETSAMFSADQLKQLRTTLGVGDDVKDDQLAPKVLEALTSGKTAASGLTEAATNLSRVSTERDTLKTQVESLQKGKAPEVDPDTIEEAADNRKTKLSRLVETGRLTPAALKVAEQKLVGEAGKRPAICLSRKAATHAGLSEPIADTVIAILEANDPAELAKLLGQRTGGQTVSLSRQTPGGDAGKSEPDTWVADAVKATNGGK